MYICLGLNDVGQFSADEYIANYKTLVENFRREIPDLKIAIQSVTPITLYGEKQVLYNAKIDEYNERLAKFAKEENCVSRHRGCVEGRGGLSCGIAFKRRLLSLDNGGIRALDRLSALSWGELK